VTAESRKGFVDVGTRQPMRRGVTVPVDEDDDLIETSLAVRPALDAQMLIDSCSPVEDRPVAPHDGTTLCDGGS